MGNKSNNALFRLKLDRLLLVFVLLFSSVLFADTLSYGYEQFIRVNVFAERDEVYISSIKADLSEAIMRFQSDMNRFPDIKVFINIAPDARAYDEWIASRPIVFENSLGFTDLTTSNIYIRHPAFLGSHRNLIRLLLHEYIHLFIDYHWADAPLWFHEGMAIFFTEKVSLNRLYNFSINNAFHRDYLLVRYAHRYPENRANIEPFYFQAALIMRKIVEEHRQELINLFKLSASHPIFDDTFRMAFRVSQEDFLASFESEIQNLFRLNLYKGILLLTWLAFPILLIIAKIKKNQKTKRLLEEWDIEHISGETIMEGHDEETKDIRT